MSQENYDPAIFVDETRSGVPNSNASETTTYLYTRKDVVEELQPEEIRWFYRNKCDKKWTLFIGYDSLRLECKYREMLLNSCMTTENVEMVLVRGGLYEADVSSQICFPVYWSEESSDILRGTWFQDISWQPLDEKYSVVLERVHLNHFKGQRLCSAETPKKGPKQVLQHVTFADFYVDWNSTDEVYIFSKARSSRLIRHVSQTLGFPKSGSRLRRGYCEEAVMDDKPADITHLVFVVHGIAQKINTKSIIKCCESLRNTVEVVKHKMCTTQVETETDRAEFLPVEWRSHLTLDGDTVEQITPQKIKGFRNLVNSSAMDVLYYTSPLYRNEIIQGLRSELNRLYLMFCERNPYFTSRKGKVSIVAHSLGSVLTYDILTNSNSINLHDQLLSSIIEEEKRRANGCHKLLNQINHIQSKVQEVHTLLRTVHEQQEHHSPLLHFPVENLFCIGSPLAVFLALRGLQPPTAQLNKSILPSLTCSKLYNIFHPSDPVAYRLEPLLHKSFIDIAPIPVPDCRVQRSAPTRSVSLPVPSKRPLEQDIPDVIPSSSGISQPKLFISNMLSRLSRSHSMDILDWTGKGEQLLPWSRNNNCNNIVSTNTSTSDCTLEPVSNPIHDIDYRVDYQLRESNFESSYISTITSHTSYWTNHDIAAFILTILHDKSSHHTQRKDWLHNRLYCL